MEKKCTVVWTLSLCKPPLRSKISFIGTKLVYKFFGNFILVTRFILLPLSQPLKKVYNNLHRNIFKVLKNSDCSLGYLQVAYTMYVQVVYTIAQVSLLEYGFLGKVHIWPEVAILSRNSRVIGNHIQSWSRVWTGIFMKVI